MIYDAIDPRVRWHMHRKDFTGNQVPVDVVDASLTLDREIWVLDLDPGAGTQPTALYLQLVRQSDGLTIALGKSTGQNPVNNVHIPLHYFLSGGTAPGVQFRIIVPAGWSLRLQGTPAADATASMQLSTLGLETPAGMLFPAR